MKGRDKKTQPSAPLEEKKGKGSNLLDKLPTDILRHSGKFIPAKKRSKKLAGLARASKRLHGVFQPAAHEEVDKILFNHIARGEPKEVYAMLDKHPSLLLHTFTVTDPAGYTLKDRTPLQAALCCQDPQMVEEIQKRLIAHTDPKEAARQWDAQFPAGWEEAEKNRWDLVFTQLDRLDTAIREAEEKDISADEDFKLEVSEGSAVEKELKEFQRLLDATRDNPIETSRMFNPRLLQRIASCYDRCYNDFLFDDPKPMLLWQRVYGYAQRFLSAPDAQAFVAGLSTTTSNLENKKPQGRNLKIQVWELESGNWREVAFYSAVGLGVDYAYAARAGELRSWNLPGAADRIFISQKQTLFRNLYRDIQIQAQCVIRPTAVL